jgi:hypothetical protein
MPVVAIPYLSALPAAERHSVLDRTAAVTAASERWLRDYPVVRRPSVTAAVALAATVGMPSLDDRGLTLLTRWWLWIFGIDDRFDDPAVPDAELVEWSDRFVDCVGGAPERDEPDLLLAALGSIRLDLARYPLSPRLGPAWRRAMSEVVAGMLVERRWHAGLAHGDLPGYDGYLANALRTISVRPYAMTACVLAGERAAAVDFDRLDPMIEAAARCFRLANDIRSDERERAEGKPNAVWLLQRELMAAGMPASWAMEAARARLRAERAADLARLDAMREAAPASVATLARFLWAHAAFVCEMYETDDYDTMSTLIRAESEVDIR